MALLSLKMAKESNDTPISNIFIDIHMPKANFTYAVVYIYGYRHCYHGRNEFSTEEIATALDILETDVVRAWKYWQDERLVKIHDDGGKISYIEFLEITDEIRKEENIKEVVKKEPVIVLDSKPHYSSKELDIYIKNDDDVRNLFETAGKNLGKLLSYNDMSTLFSFYDWLRLPIDVIDLLIVHCANNGHRSMRYIEKVAISWAEKNISTLALAKEHLRVYNNDFRQIMKAFGINQREPIEMEEEYLRKWIYVYKFPIDIIKESCKRAIMQTGKANFPYADEILSSWYKNDVRLIGDIEKLDAEYFENNKPKMDKKAVKPLAKKNRFVNYEQREWDFEALEKLEKEYLENN